jgi:hypothetical protein
VRERDGDGGAQAGGWGPVRALLPFELDGRTLTFSTGLSAIGDDDGKFRYRVFTTHQGAITSQAIGAVIPLPTAVWAGATMLGAIAAARKIRRRAAA